MKDPIKKPVEKRTWQQFRNTGILLFINSILHAFGWAIVIEVDKEGNAIESYPARVKFRGFDEDSVTEEHIKLANYLAENAPNFPEEIKD